MEKIMLDDELKRPRDWKTKAAMRVIYETVGGGFVIFRRGRISNKIKAPYNPIERASLDEAITEAERLALTNPGNTFHIFAEVAKRGEK